MVHVVGSLHSTKKLTLWTVHLKIFFKTHSLRMGHLWLKHSNLGALKSYIFQAICLKSKYLPLLLNRDVGAMQNNLIGSKYPF